MTISFIRSSFSAGARTHRFAVDSEIVAVGAVLALAALIAIWTVGDYAITVDEFNADDYGQKSLAWYTSFFTNRSNFDSVEDTLWFYGPWFHILTTWVQSLDLAEHWTARHLLTFLFGLASLAALLPMARLASGRWAGLIAVGLCLTTGYLYGSLFFTPIDVPFMFAMTWATLAIVVMSARVVPSWPATVGAGLLSGLAIATRAPGLITQVYLVGAMILCTVDALLSDSKNAWPLVARIAGRTAAAL